MAPPIRFGFVPTTRLLTQRALLSQWSAVTAPTEWVSCGDYAELVSKVSAGRVDAAWLPPVTYVRAAALNVVDPVFSLRRAGHGRYAAAIICAEASSYQRLDQLEGARAAWVDPWSAAGYLMPRRLLRDAGIHPDRDLWQRMYGSYTNVLEALALGHADIGGIYCSIDAFHTVIRAGWTGADRVRLLKVSEPIAGDVIVRVRHRETLEMDAWIDAVESAATAPEHASLLRDVFGAESMSAPDPLGYEALEVAMRDEMRG